METGNCMDDEICVDERSPGVRISQEAYCVKKSKFMRAGDPRANTLELGNTNLRLAITDTNGKTPLEMKKIEVNAFDESKVGDQPIQEGICEDCVGVSTQALPSEVGDITTEAWSAWPMLVNHMVIGIIWLMFFPA